MSVKPDRWWLKLLAWLVGAAGFNLFISLPGLAQTAPNSSPPPVQIAPVQAMPRSPQAVLEQLFTTDPVQAAWFAPEFLSQISLAQVQQIIADLQADLGAYRQVQIEGDRWFVTFERGRVAAQIVLDRQGQIAGLRLQPEPDAITPEQAIAQLQTLPGQVNFLVLENSTEIAALNADQPLAVGSAFKLAVLATLNQQIEAEQRHWNDVVALQPDWKSLPSGILQTWSDGTVLTLQTLATLMISISDNTATDVLIHTLGRESIEALTPHNQPLLTTREFFILKTSQNQELLQRYRSANLAERRQILAEIANYSLPDLDSATATSEGLLAGQPTALDIEYFLTPHELCNLMSSVKDLPLMGINPSNLVNPSDWSRVAYKGGSEPGVLNLTHWLETPEGKTYCVVTTWNNHTTPLEENRLFTLHSAVIRGLREQAP